VEVILRYIIVSRFTSGGYLEVYPGVKVYWWSLSCGISWCQCLLVEVILRYIMVSRFISRGCLEVYLGVKVYWWRVF
jgi:hypothetical protein